MKTIMMAAALFSTATYAATTMVTFEASTVGQPPSDWTCGATGKGPPHWGVETDTSAPSGAKVLKQSGSATYPWCVKNVVAMPDGVVEVKFKPTAGQEDKAGGGGGGLKRSKKYYVARV